MKHFLTIIMLVLISQTGMAANYYTKFTAKNETYTELNSPTIITTTFDKEGYKIGTPLKLFGLNWDSVEVEAFGAVIGKNKTADRMFAVDGFSVKKFLKRDATSSISYTFEGTAGSRILKIQYKNVTPKDGDAAQDYVNFQFWLSENGDKIEIHMGDCKISDPSKVFTFDTDKGPQTGIFLSNIAFTTKYEIIWLSGNPASPNANTTLFGSFNSIPANGQTYVFEHKTTAEQPKLELLAPIAMEKWVVGEKREIKWKSTLIRKIKIEYSYQGFSNYEIVEDSIDASAGSYLWTVPNTVSDQCVVKITDVDLPTRYSETAIFFSIKTSSTTVIESKFNTAPVKIYPNPNSGKFNINCPGDGKIKSVNIITPEGKSIFSNTYIWENKNNVSINLENTSAGIYIVNICTTEGNCNSLLLIE